VHQTLLELDRARTLPIRGGWSSGFTDLAQVRRRECHRSSRSWP